MQCSELLSKGENINCFQFNSGKGSVLLMCLVLLSSLSAVALSALEAAWSGQRMISAYISHQQTFLKLERALLKAEHLVWQQINVSGLEQFLLVSPATDNTEAETNVTAHGEWIGAEFPHQQCGPLFSVVVSSVNHLDSELNLSVRWDVCCETAEFCMASAFAQKRRLWSRISASDQSL